MLSDQQQYRYMTGDEMKSMGDDSMRVNVTDDERDNRHSGGKISPKNRYTHTNPYLSLSAGAYTVTISPFVHLSVL